MSGAAGKGGLVNGADAGLEGSRRSRRRRRGRRKNADEKGGLGDAEGEGVTTVEDQSAATESMNWQQQLLLGRSEGKAGGSGRDRKTNQVTPKQQQKRAAAPRSTLDKGQDANGSFQVLSGHDGLNEPLAAESAMNGSLEFLTRINEFPPNAGTNDPAGSQLPALALDVGAPFEKAVARERPGVAPREGVGASGEKIAPGFEKSFAAVEKTITPPERAREPVPPGIWKLPAYDSITRGEEMFSPGTAAQPGQSLSQSQNSAWLGGSNAGWSSLFPPVQPQGGASALFDLFDKAQGSREPSVGLWHSGDSHELGAPGAVPADQGALEGAIAREVGRAQDAGNHVVQPGRASVFTDPQLKHADLAWELDALQIPSVPPAFGEQREADQNAASQLPAWAKSKLVVEKEPQPPGEEGALGLTGLARIGAPGEDTAGAGTAEGDAPAEEPPADGPDAQTKAAMEAELNDGRARLKTSQRFARLQFVRDPQAIEELRKSPIQRRVIDRLEDSLREVFGAIIPPEHDRTRRASLVRHLTKVCRREWPDSKLLLFGSSGNGLELRDGDVDVCAIVPPEDVTYDPARKPMSNKQIIRRSAKILRKARMEELVVLSSARVPIVKFLDPVSGFNVDMCVNNVLAQHNTALIAKYVELDNRVRPLIICLKYWAKRRDLNRAYHGTLSSYSYALLMIHFLQRRPVPVLPCLQQCYRSRPLKAGRPKVLAGGWNVYFDEDFEFPTEEELNQETVGELMFQFFWFYAFIFDYETQVVSPRTGQFLNKADKTWRYVRDEDEPEYRGVWDSDGDDTGDPPNERGRRDRRNENHFFAIEDPFDLSHDLGRVVNSETLDIIHDEFIRAVSIICGGGNFHEVCEVYEGKVDAEPQVDEGGPVVANVAGTLEDDDSSGGF